MMVIAVSSLLIVLNERIDTIDPKGGGGSFKSLNFQFSPLFFKDQGVILVSYPQVP